VRVCVCVLDIQSHSSYESIQQSDMAVRSVENADHVTLSRHHVYVHSVMDCVSLAHLVGDWLVRALVQGWIYCDLKRNATCTQATVRSVASISHG
jgi:hypothetical protein